MKNFVKSVFVVAGIAALTMVAVPVAKADWVPITGSARSSVTDGKSGHFEIIDNFIYALGKTGGGVFKWNKSITDSNPLSGSWESMTGGGGTDVFKKGPDDKFYIMGENGAIYRWDGGSQGWAQVTGGGARTSTINSNHSGHFEIIDNFIYALGGDGAVYKWSKSITDPDPLSGNWGPNLTGSAGTDVFKKGLDNKFYMLGQNGAVYQWNGGWVQITGDAARTTDNFGKSGHFEIIDGFIHALGQNGNIARWNRSITDQNPLSGGWVNIVDAGAVDIFKKGPDGRFYALTTNGAVFRWDAALSCVPPATISPAQGSTVTVDSNSKISVSWDAVPGASSYNIRLNDNTDSSFNSDPAKQVHLIAGTGGSVKCTNSPHYICENGVPSTITSVSGVPVVPGHSYTFWVDPVGSWTDYCNKASTFAVSAAIPPNNSPFGFIDIPAGNATVSGTVTVEGWVADREDFSPEQWQFTVDGTPAYGNVSPLSSPFTRFQRPDVCNSKFQDLGFSSADQCNQFQQTQNKPLGLRFYWDTGVNTNGVHTIALIVTDKGGISATLGSRAVTVSNAGAPTITVISPNGGEVWEVGKTYQIRWDATNYSTNAKVVIGLDVTPNSVTEIGSTVNSGSFSYTVPESLGGVKLSGSTYKVLVSVYNSNTQNYDGDRSNAPFTIQPPESGPPLTSAAVGTGTIYSASESESGNDGSATTALASGNPVIVTALGNNLAVRASPHGSLIRQVTAFTKGAIDCSKAGSIACPTIQNGFVWWYVDYQTGEDGWSAEKFANPAKGEEIYFKLDTGETIVGQCPQTEIDRATALTTEAVGIITPCIQNLSTCNIPTTIAQAKAKLAQAASIIAACKGEGGGSGGGVSFSSSGSSSGSPYSSGKFVVMGAPLGDFGRNNVDQGELWWVLNGGLTGCKIMEQTGGSSKTTFTYELVRDISNTLIGSTRLPGPGFNYKPPPPLPGSELPIEPNYGPTAEKMYEIQCDSDSVGGVGADLIRAKYGESKPYTVGGAHFTRYQNKDIFRNPLVDGAPAEGVATADGPRISFSVTANGKTSQVTGDAASPTFVNFDSPQNRNVTFSWSVPDVYKSCNLTKGDNWVKNHYNKKVIAGDLVEEVWIGDFSEFVGSTALSKSLTFEGNTHSETRKFPVGYSGRNGFGLSYHLICAGPTVRPATASAVILYKTNDKKPKKADAILENAQDFKIEAQKSKLDDLIEKSQNSIQGN